MQEKNIKYKRGVATSIDLIVPNDLTNREIIFTVKENETLTANRIIEKKKTLNQITAYYNANKNETTVIVNLIANDTHDLQARSYPFDVDSISLTNDLDLKTPLSGDFILDADVRTPFDGVDLPANAKRFVAVMAENFANNDVIRVSEVAGAKTFTGIQVYSKTEVDDLLNLELNESAFSTFFNNRLATKTLDDIAQSGTRVHLTQINLTKLNSIEAGAQVNTVTSVAGRDGAVVLTKVDVGLTNVDNTSDLLKPISTATQTALDLKANLANPTFTGTVGGITKAMVGLSNVDNTSDASKPVSTAQQTALNLKFDTTNFNSTFDTRFGTRNLDQLLTGTTNIHLTAIRNTEITTNFTNINTTLSNKANLVSGKLAVAEIPNDIRSTAATPLTFGVGATEFARFNPTTGSLFIGRTTDPASGNRFAVEGNSHFNGNMRVNTINYSLSTQFESYDFSVGAGTQDAWWVRAIRINNIANSNGTDGGAFGVLGRFGNTPMHVYMAIPEATLSSTGWDSTKIIALHNSGNVSIGSRHSPPADIRLRVTGNIMAASFRVSELNTAPLTPTSAGIAGEWRICASGIFYCTATDTWKKLAEVAF